MIKAFKPMVTPSGTSVCITFQKDNKEVSIALDDSCGRMENLSRSDIRLHMIDKDTREFVSDVTESVFGATAKDNLHGSLDNFNKAMKWLNHGTWNPEDA